MPNHVDILIEPRLPHAKITGVINAGLGRPGKPFWQDESFDIGSDQKQRRLRSHPQLPTATSQPSRIIE
jgi:hypothetical protein